MGYSEMKYLITGGTGSFGSAFIRAHEEDEFIVYSRDWQKQKELAKSLPEEQNVRFVLGDVRDFEQLRTVVEFDVPDVIIHAAAIKCIEACEINVEECVKTNVDGTRNVAKLCYEYDIRGVLISTDKAVLPINVYGTSKKMAEKIWISYGLNVARYGNVVGSSGSVVPLYKKLIAEGAKLLPVTDERMTRFWFGMDEAISLVDEAVTSLEVGHVFTSEMPSIRIVDLCRAFNMPYTIVGMREGEKLHEDLIPPDPITGTAGYNSGNNPHFLTVDEIRRTICES